MALENILAVDVGADSIKAAEFSFPSSDAAVLEHFDLREFGGDQSDEELSAAQCNALYDILADPNFTAKKVYLCISGQLVFLKFVKLPPVSDPSRLRQAADAEAKQNMPFDIDEVEWDIQLLPQSEPGGEPEAVFAVIKKNVIEQITDAVEAAGRKVEMVDTAPTAGYNAARLNGLGQEECCILLNIGGRTSTLTFIESNRFFTRTIPIGGHSITEGIAKEFGITYREAEDMKRQLGFVALGGAYEEPQSETANIVSKIARNVMTRLHGEINRSMNMYRASQGGSRPEKMYLVGGSSIMQYTPFFFNEKMRIPVEYLNPFGIVGVGQYVNRETLEEHAHMFSDVIGVAMRAVTGCPVQVSLMPSKLLRRYSIRARMPYLYTGCGVLLLCAGTFFIGSYIKSSALEKQQFKSRIEQTTALLNQINDAQSECDGAYVRLKAAKTPLVERTRWVNAISQFQELLPENAWTIRVKTQTAGVNDDQNNRGRDGEAGESTDATYTLLADVCALCTQDRSSAELSKNVTARVNSLGAKSLFDRPQTPSNVPYAHGEPIKYESMSDEAYAADVRKYMNASPNMTYTQFRFTLKSSTPKQEQE